MEWGSSVWLCVVHCSRTQEAVGTEIMPLVHPIEEVGLLRERAF